MSNNRKTCLMSFATVTKNGVVTDISHSIIGQPPIKFKGGEIPWFDDSKLIKKNNDKK